LLQQRLREPERQWLVRRAHARSRGDFAPLGDANGPIKQAIFGLNSARLYRLNLKAADASPMPDYSADRLAQLKKEYEFAAKEPSNLRYGYVRAGW
jgi:uncharacterized protein